MNKILVTVLALSISQITFAKDWSFTAYLDGKEMGSHSFVLNEREGESEMTSTAKFKVKLLFINAYSYYHVAKERWRGDCLAGLEAKTEENRETTIVKAKSDADGLVVDGPKGKVNIGQCGMTFTYWNPKMLTQSKLLNPQTGEWLDVKIKQLANETIEVKGQSIDALHYKLEATKMNIELWYTQDKDWVALKSTTPEGYVVTYKRK